MINNKKYIIFIAIFIVLFSFVFSSISSAATNDSVYCTFPAELYRKVMDLPEWSDTNWGCVGFQYDFKVKDGYRIFFIENTDKSMSFDIKMDAPPGTRFAYDFHGGHVIVYDYDSSYELYQREDIAKLGYYSDDKSSRDEYLFKNINVYNDGKLFFQSTPVLVGVMAPEALMRMEILPLEIRQTVITLTKAGLIIFSTLLLVYLITSRRWLKL